MTLPKPINFEVERYIGGLSQYKRINDPIKLSANESALGPSPKAIQAIEKDKNKTFKYPETDCNSLREVLSEKFNIDAKRIICGSGSDQIFDLTCHLFLNPGDEVIVTEFGFIMHRIYASLYKAKIVLAKEKNFKASVEEILGKVTDKTKIVFIANPNNPTGTYLNKLELISLRKKLNKNILLVIDDAYHEYNLKKDYISGLNLFKKSKNVFVLRTFSKLYGLASLRIGWGYGDKKIIDALYKIKPPFNVNYFAELCATKAILDKGFVRKSVRHNLFWGNKIKKIFENYKIYSNEVNTNFLLLNFDKSKISSKLFFEKLVKNGILVRGMKEYNIKNSLRLSIGNSNENKYLLKVTRKIFKNV